MKVIFRDVTQANGKKAQKKKSYSLNGIPAHDLCDTAAKAQSLPKKIFV